MGKGALDGVKVLDLTRVLAGPYAAMMLADLGADVIKIERPKYGDDTRAFEPSTNGESAYFYNLNRNKRGITLDLKNEDGKKVFLELVKKADVVLENFRPGVMEKLGLGYDKLKEVNPKIIYGSVSGFGHYGPYTKRPGYDIIAQAMGGLMSTTGWPDGLPTRSGTAIGDILGGMNVTIGILSAYISRQKTGIGQKVDVALVDSVVSGLEAITQIYLTSGKEPTRTGNRYASSYPYDSFKTKDGMIVIGAGNDKLYFLLCDLMGKPELKTEEKFLTNPLRLEHFEELKEIIENWLSDYSSKDAVDMLLDKGVPAGPINTIKDIVKDPHIADAREMFVEIDHPKAGRVKVTGNPIKLSGTPVKIEKAAPTLGQHTNEVLKEYLNLTDKEIEELDKKGIF